MKVITTRHLPATHTKPHRIVAEDATGASYIAERKFNLDPIDNHRRAAEILAYNMKWVTIGHLDRLVGGPTKTGYAFVILEESAP